MKLRHHRTATAAALLFLGASLARGETTVLELSLEDAVQRALENNVDLAVARDAHEAAAESTNEAAAVYEPLLLSTIRQQSLDEPARSLLTGLSAADTRALVVDFEAQKPLKTGGLVRLDFRNDRLATTSTLLNYNPSFGTSLNATITQPLLRNRAIDERRYAIRVAAKGEEVSAQDLRAAVLNTAARAKHLYCDLLYARDHLEIQKRSLALAERLLEDNRARVAVGSLSPLALAEAEAEVASRQEGVIAAEGLRGDVEAALKRIIFAKSDAMTRATVLVPTSRLALDETARPDVESAVAAALRNRTDVAALRRRLEVIDATGELARDRMRPHVDLTASVGLMGIGGTHLDRAGLTQPVLSTTPGGYGDALRNLLRSDYPTWSVGLDVSLPVGNRQASAAAARARADRGQIEAQVRRLEMRIATEIEDAARAVSTARQSLAASRASRALQAKRLEAEEGRAANGLSTTFLLAQAQRDLAAAETAELRTATAYRQSWIELDRLQEAGADTDPGSLNLGTPAGGVPPDSPRLPDRAPLAASF